MILLYWQFSSLNSYPLMFQELSPRGIIKYVLFQELPSPGDLVLEVKNEQKMKSVMRSALI